MGRRTEILGMAQQCLPGGTRLTRGAQTLIMRADGLGVPPGRILQAVLSAAKSTEGERRTKVGPFGGAQTAFESLRLEALRRQQDLVAQGRIRRPK